MKINIKLLNNKCMPIQATAESAGFDLYASIDENVTIKPMQRVLIPTGFCIELPEMHEAQIRSRSGLAYKNGVCVLNSPGTIDSDYRKEVKVILINFSDAEFIVEPYFRIAQMIINKLNSYKLQSGDIELNDRGGFGSTGIK
ncbi:dUTP diphosphatase [Candidatus Cytomitobacter primus]|uniref:dUTP diphosphatase n=1 Tax=Candidatus Cytomitobacter primus TaxID=2066024 RepID=A0A5C0UEQ0_9PROT|nr:dUTP diphosphatase [Candidatus Cytomitobacter primus]QEK38575.1 dUTP diphosphatase [Candidatus Cytomitobacter primus]